MVTERAMTKKTDKIEQELQRRDKDELVAIIQLMLQQQPELAWVLQAPLSGKKKHEQPGNSNAGLYRRQIETAVFAAAKHDRDRTYLEALQNVLVTLQTMAEEFSKHQDTVEALTLYEVLVVEAIEHFSDVETGYLLFTPILYNCIDGLDTCFADAEENHEIRQRALKALFAIYRFSTASSMDLGEDIPDLLLENTTVEEHLMIAGWVREILAHLSSKVGSVDTEAHTYRLFLRKLER